MYRAPLNEIQADILRKLRRLALGETMRFAALKEKDIPSDQFSYHLRQLQKTGLIQKHPDNSYSLSVAGKSQAPLIAPHSEAIARQGYVATRVVLSKMIDGERHILMQKRSVNPQFGLLATPGGKIMYGSDAEEAAKFYMHRQTGLDCDMTVKGLLHFIDDLDGNIVQDRYFFVYLASNPRGELLPEGPRGQNMWVPYSQLGDREKCVPGDKAVANAAFGDSIIIAEEHFSLEDF